MKRAISIGKLPEPQPEPNPIDLDKEVSNTVTRALENMLSDALMRGGTRAALRKIIAENRLDEEWQEIRPEIRMLNRLSSNLLRLPIRISSRIDGDRCIVSQSAAGRFCLVMSPLGLARLRQMHPEHELNVEGS